MSTNTGEIQPVASGPWVAPELNKKESRSVPPVARAEGGTPARVGEDEVSRDGSSSLSDSKVSAEVARQVNSFLKETTGIQLNFVVEKGGAIVQILDVNSGKVIRQIPAETAVRFRDKLEELRGIIFDGKA